MFIDVPACQYFLSGALTASSARSPVATGMIILGVLILATLAVICVDAWRGWQATPGNTRTSTAQRLVTPLRALGRGRTARRKISGAFR